MAEPIIDMHMHAASPAAFGGPQTVCTNRDAVEFPPVDLKSPATVQVTATCGHPLASAKDGDDNAKRTGAIMRAYNIYGVLGVTQADVPTSLAAAKQWLGYAPGRYWIALDFGDVTVSEQALTALTKSGEVQLFAEVSPQYEGETANAERLEPFFALAEKLDVPVGLHLGEGPPGGASVMPGSKYSPAAGRPLDLEPLLQRHPKLPALRHALRITAGRRDDRAALFAPEPVCGRGPERLGFPARAFLSPAPDSWSMRASPSASCSGRTR